MTKTERKRAAAILKRQEAQALGWSGFDDAEDAKKLIVVLRHMFTLEEMYSDVNLRKELEEDVVEDSSMNISEASAKSSDIASCASTTIPSSAFSIVALCATLS